MSQEPVLVPLDENPIKGIDSKTDVMQAPKDIKLTLAESKLSPEQIMAIRARTPKQFIKPLKGRGGKELSYIPGAVFIRKLNFVFGYGGWTHEIIKSEIVEDHAIVQGRLTIMSTGTTVAQFGGHPIAREIIAYEKNGMQIAPWKYAKMDRKDQDGWIKKYGSYVDPGDSFKAAATDCLKKCASTLGLFADVYSPENFVPLEPEEDVKKKVLTPPRERQMDERTFNGALKLLQKMDAKSIKKFLRDLNPSKLYSATQKRVLIDAADKRMSELADGEPVK